MSVYLGNQKVGVSYKDIDENVLDPETLAELSDATGYRVGDYISRTVPQMIEKLKSEYFENRESDIGATWIDTPWVRPAGWPDLDSLNLQFEGDDFIYMTYDNNSYNNVNNTALCICLYITKVKNGKDIKVEYGHIENNLYIVDGEITNSNNFFNKELRSINSNYVVVRVTGDIATCQCRGVTANDYSINCYQQPILERIAYVPHLTQFCSNVNNSLWGTYTLQRDVVNNGDGTALTSTYGAWSSCYNLYSLDISGLKTQNVTTFSYMFNNCLKLKSLDLRHLNVEKVTTFTRLFYNCRFLQSIDIRGWNTLALTSLENTFYNCLSLQEIKGIESLKTDLVTTLSSTFLSCYSLKKLNIGSWNTEKVTTLYQTFYDCRKIEELDLSDWDVSKVTNLSTTFCGCYCLKRLNLSGWQTSTLTSVSNLFAGCHSLTTLDISWLQVTSSCTNIYSMFSNCWSLKRLDIPTWNVGGLSSSNNTGNSMFSACYSLETITGIKNWNFQHTNSLSSVFANCWSLKNVDVSGWGVSTVTSLASLFENCYSLKTLNLASWQPQNVTTFASMFSYCNSLKSVGNISNWNTAKVTTMANMFRYCYSLSTFPNISNWNYSEVTSTGDMFCQCYALKQVEWKNISLPKCTNINTMFRYCYNLESIDLSGWTVSAVTNNTSYYMTFGGCYSLKEVKGFPIPSTYTNIGFADCYCLTRESLLFIVNALPQVSGTHTLHISAETRNLLTDAEKAIATDKGWTIAN